MLRAGYPLSAVTEALCDRWQPGVRLLPMSDDRVETHVVIDDPEQDGQQKAVHFQEWWVRYRAEPQAHSIVAVGADEAKPAPGVLDAIAGADAVLFAPSNPVVSVGTVLGVPGVRDALRSGESARRRGVADHRRQGAARDGRRVPDRDRRRDRRPRRWAGTTARARTAACSTAG